MPVADLDRSLLSLLVAIAAIIAVARLLGVAFRAVRQPQVVGEIVAGILLGPSLLGWLAPAVSAALFPPAVLPLLEALAEIGIALFMFLVGLELDPALLRRRQRTALAIGATGIALPFGLGALLAVGLHGAFAPPGVPLAAFALFLGVAMSITAFPVLARILVERGLARTPLGALALSCAAVNDLAAWAMLLAMVTLLRAEATPAAAVADLAWALAYGAVMLLAARPLLRRLAVFYELRGGLSQNLLAAVLILLLASAAAAHATGIHLLFGAFLLGALMPKQRGLVRDLSERMEDLVTVFFLPLYFAITGLRTSIGLLDSAASWLAAGLVIGVAVAGKFAGGALAARWAGTSWREAGALGALLNARGLMELVILNVGLDLGVISASVFAMMVLMAVVTTAMTTPALGLIYPPGRLRAEAVAAAAEAGGAVLVPVALAASGPRLLDVALGLARDQRPRVYALHVARPIERGTLGADVGADVGAAGGGDAALAPLLAHAGARGVAVRPLVVSGRDPASDICEVARLKDARLIVLGWHKPVFAQSVLGGTIDRVLRRAPGDVAIFIDKGLAQPIGSILLPYAGTGHDRLALELAARLSRRAGAPLTLLHVVRPGRAAPRLEREAQAALDAGVDPATGQRVAVEVVESAEPVDAVIAAAARHDLTVLGVGEEWQLERSLFGLRSERVAVEAPSSLLIVRAAAAP